MEQKQYSIEFKTIRPLQSDIETAGFSPGSQENQIRNAWITNEEGTPITKAAPGEKIKVWVSARVVGGSDPLSWRPCVTVKELTGTTNKFKNASHEEVWFRNYWDNTAFPLDGYPDGSTVMPARNMILAIKLWARGDILNAWPPEEEWL